MAEETQVLGAGGLQGGEPLNLQAWIADQFGIDAGEELGDVGKTECHTAPAVLAMVIVVNTPAVNGRRSAP